MPISDKGRQKLMSDITNYENLANAIILQAVKDYRMALKP